MRSRQSIRGHLPHEDLSESRVILVRPRKTPDEEAVKLMHQDGETRPPTIVVSGSLAYDHIMSFPGSFQDHIIPGKVHVLSVSFLFDSLRRDRGGVAGNVAYSLALLGERPAIVGAGGSDFAEYRAACELVGVDMTHVVDVETELTGSSFMTTDRTGNQIAGFYPGASTHACDISVSDLARDAIFGFVGPTTLEAMRRHAREFAESGCRLIYDPSQQLVSLTRDDLLEGIGSAWALIGSDYEMAVIGQKTGLSVEELTMRVPFLGVTFGQYGSELHYDGRRVTVPAAPVDRVGDPTGGGDAYRAGLIKGLMLGLPLEIAGRMGSLAATFAVEQHGPQEQTYSAEQFIARFDREFADFAGVLDAPSLKRPVERVAALASLAGVAVRGD